MNREVKGKGKYSATAGAFYTDSAPVLLNYCLYDSQADTVFAALALVEAFKDKGQVLIGNALTVISDLNNNLAALLSAADGYHLAGIADRIGDDIGKSPGEMLF